MDNQSRSMVAAYIEKFRKMSRNEILNRMYSDGGYFDERREAGRLVLGEMDASIAREANNAACEANRIARLDLNAQRRQARWAMIAAVAAIIAMVAAIWAKS